ncbi:DUF4153 domain-containing protein [Clostridium gelidum]|uniref:DUF4153 domain-containing protein n=1 Tax=Clostridium gelidum TaxID=704125 RepID=A0ABM7T2M6_9CLOT|nr:DUF4153 domain-containing protein [Clostridium gelidum]BCZ46169.1 DUF4153 domain-containing protein [Clostridium gelidum]
MKAIDTLRNKLSGLYDAISRYPLTVIFLIVAAVVNANAINRGEPYYKLLLTFVVGACLGFTLQAAFERFFEKFLHRVVSMVICVVLTMGYFLIVNQYTTTSLETWIRTSVAVFALVIAYIWVPVIKSTVSFNESFMSSFKSFFNSLLFSVVLFTGISMIIAAIDLLLFQVDGKSYMHALNIISILFAPIYFLSLIPVYPGISNKTLFKESQDYNRENITRSSSCPKFLEILLSYIIIPLLSIYTVILVIYIAKNITGKFWTDNRLEPMLVGFAITVILIYILVSRIENKFAKLFRKIFPKILVPIVVFQIVSSILRTQDTGIMHGRYYVILFGIFAAVSGVFLSFIPVRKNGIVAMLLIVFALFSIIPPLDAFTISRTNQQKMLQSVLVKNKMLLDNKITPNPSVSQEDKKIISSTLNYLEMMGYTKNIDYLGKDFNLYNDFYDTFGFYQYEESMYRQESVHMSLNQQSPIIISGYDALVVLNFYFEKDNPTPSNKLCDFKSSGKTYTISNINSFDSGKLWLSNDKGEELISVNMKDVFDMFDTSAQGNYQISKDSMTADNSTFTKENDNAIISLVALNINIQKSNSEHPYSGDFYVLVKIK